MKQSSSGLLRLFCRSLYISLLTLALACDLTSPDAEIEADDDDGVGPETFEILRYDPPDGARNVNYSSTFKITIEFSAIPENFDDKLSVTGGLSVSSGTAQESPFENFVAYNVDGTPTDGGNYTFTLAGGMSTSEEGFDDSVTEEVSWDVTFFDSSVTAFTYPASGGSASNDCSGLDALTGDCWVYLKGGTITMGDNSTGDDALSPAHNVYLDPYYISKFTMTNADHRQCVSDGKCPNSLSSEYTNSKYTRKNYIGEIMTLDFDGPYEGDLFQVSYSRGSVGTPMPTFSFQSGTIKIKYSNSGTSTEFNAEMEIQSTTTFEDIKRRLECGEWCDYEFYLPDEACATPTADGCPIDIAIDETNSAVTPEDLFNIEFVRGSPTDPQQELPTISYNKNHVDGEVVTINYGSPAMDKDLVLQTAVTDLDDLKAILECTTNCGGFTECTSASTGCVNYNYYLPDEACASPTANGCPPLVTVVGTGSDIVDAELTHNITNKTFGDSADSDDYTYRLGQNERLFSKYVDKINNADFGDTGGSEYIYTADPVYPALKFAGDSLSLSYNNQNLAGSAGILNGASDTATFTINAGTTFSNIENWLEVTNNFQINQYGCHLNVSDGGIDDQDDCDIRIVIRDDSGGGGLDYGAELVQDYLPEFSKSPFSFNEPLEQFGAETVPYYTDSVYDDYPVLYLDQEEAKSLCDWYDDGNDNGSATIPTEAHWEFAAVGGDNTIYDDIGLLTERIFPSTVFDLSVDSNDPNYNLNNLPMPCSDVNYFQVFDYNPSSYVIGGTGSPDIPNHFFGQVYCQSSLNSYVVEETDNLFTITYPDIQDDQDPARLTVDVPGSCDVTGTTISECVDNKGTWTHSTDIVVTVEWRLKKCYNNGVVEPTWDNELDCLNGGSCSGGGHTTQQDCESDSETWTPSPSTMLWQTYHECSNAGFNGDYDGCIGNGDDWEEPTNCASDPDCNDYSVSLDHTAPDLLADAQSELAKIELPDDACEDPSQADEQCLLVVKVNNLPHPFGLSSVAPGNPDVKTIADLAETYMIGSTINIPGVNLPFSDINDSWAVNNRPSPVPGDNRDLRSVDGGTDYIYGMMGNVWEWTSSNYISYPMADMIEPEADDPTSDYDGDGETDTNSVVIKGGSSASSVLDIRAITRGTTHYQTRSGEIGVRCAKYKFGHP